MTPSQLHLVGFQPSGKRISVYAGTNLLEAARRAGVKLSGTCGGQGDCGQCCVEIVQGNVPALTSEEIECLSPLELRGNLRLACHIRITNPLVVFIPQKYREQQESQAE